MIVTGPPPLVDVAYAGQPVIDRFVGKHEYLSNFWKSPVMLGHFRYLTVEHAFQAAKTRDPEARGEICRAATPGAAKRLGRRVALRPDWEDVKIDIMRLLVTRKFTDHGDLHQRLLGTGDAYLIEGNTWGDSFWGAVRDSNVDGSPWRGWNQLGRILMDVRRQLRVEWATPATP